MRLSSKHTASRTRVPLWCVVPSLSLSDRLRKAAWDVAGRNANRRQVSRCQEVTGLVLCSKPCACGGGRWCTQPGAGRWWLSGTCTPPSRTSPSGRAPSTSGASAAPRPAEEPETPQEPWVGGQPEPCSPPIPSGAGWTCCVMNSGTLNSGSLRAKNWKRSKSDD